MNKYVQGILAMPSFSIDIQEIAERLEVEPITPDLSEYDVRYRQGQQHVHDKILELCKDPTATFDSSFLSVFQTNFNFPECNLETPVTTMMFWAGVAKGLEKIKDYMEGIGD